MPLCRSPSKNMVTLTAMCEVEDRQGWSPVPQTRAEYHMQDTRNVTRNIVAHAFPSAKNIDIQRRKLNIPVDNILGHAESFGSISLLAMSTASLEHRPSSEAFNRPDTKDSPGDKRQNNATTGASAASMRALTARMFAFYFRVPVKAFFRTRIE